MKKRYEWHESDSETAGVFYAGICGNGLDGLVRGTSQDKVNRKAEKMCALLNRDEPGNDTRTP